MDYEFGFVASTVEDIVYCGTAAAVNTTIKQKNKQIIHRGIRDIEKFFMSKLPTIKTFTVTMTEEIAIKYGVLVVNPNPN